MYFLNFITCALRLASSYDPIFPFTLDGGAPACLSVSVVCDAVNAREMNGAWLREFFSWRKNVSRVYLGRGVVEQFFHYQLGWLHTNYIVRT